MKSGEATFLEGRAVSTQPPAAFQPSPAFEDGNARENIRPIAAIPFNGSYVNDSNFLRIIAIVPTTEGGFKKVFPDRVFTGAAEAELQASADGFRDLGAVILPETAGPDVIDTEIKRAANDGAFVIVVGHSVKNTSSNEGPHNLIMPNGEALREDFIHMYASRSGVKTAVLTCLGRDFDLRHKITISEALKMCQEGKRTFIAFSDHLHSHTPGSVNKPVQGDKETPLAGTLSKSASFEEIISAMRRTRTDRSASGIILRAATMSSELGDRSLVIWENVLIRQSPIGKASALAAIGVVTVLFGFWRTDIWLCNIRRIKESEFGGLVKHIAFAHERQAMERWAIMLVGIVIAALAAVLVVRELDLRQYDFFSSENSEVVLISGFAGLVTSILAVFLVKSYPYLTGRERSARAFAAVASWPFLQIAILLMPHILVLSLVALVWVGFVYFIAPIGIMGYILALILISASVLVVLSSVTLIVVSCFVIISSLSLVGNIGYERTLTMEFIKKNIRFLCEITKYIYEDVMENMNNSSGGTFASMSNPHDDFLKAQKKSREGNARKYPSYKEFMTSAPVVL